jgi:hypothetical protein
MKQDDGIFEIGKNNYLFLVFANSFLLFSISKMNVEERIIEKLQKTIKKETTNLKEEK